MMVLSLIALIFCILVMVVSIRYSLLYTTQNMLKNDLNAAVHAASLSIDETQLAKGYFMLDTTTPGTRAQDMFYKYLQLNMDLDSNNKAMTKSKVPVGTTVNINELIYVDYESRTLVNMGPNPTSCSLLSSTAQVTCEVTLNNGSSTEITRVVNQTVRGPSVVAIVNTYHKELGSMNQEPLLIPAVQEVFFRKK